MMAQNDAGKYNQLKCDTNGHFEVALHSPRLPFGSVHSETATPIFQADAVYGVNSFTTISTISGTGSVGTSNSTISCQTGTTALSSATLQSRKRLRYRPGQGVVARFAGSFSTPAANSYQVIGVGHAEDGVFFGYKGALFGIIHNSRGSREVQTLTVGTKSSTGENAVITLDGVAFNVPVTNGATTVTTAYEISQGTYTGWKAEAIGSTVVFVCDSVGNKTGSFSATGSTLVATFAETKAGAAVTESFIPQTDWNGDKLDGSGSSGVTSDWSKLNEFQIKIQYPGTVVMQVEEVGNGNDPSWVTVHTIVYTNTSSLTPFGNPSFPFTMSAYSAGSTTNLTTNCSSLSGFTEGIKGLHGPRISYIGQSASVGTANYQCLFTIRNTRYYGGRTNQSVINLLSSSGTQKASAPTVIYVFRNATLAGSPNFSQVASTSCAYIDTAATTCTISTNDQLIWTGVLGDTGNYEFSFEDDITIQPGETITFAARAVSGAPSFVVATLNTREDQ